VPTVDWVDDLRIAIHYGDHPPPHVNVVESGRVASVAIETRTVLRGRLSPQALRKVKDWVDNHEEQLLVTWDRAVRKLPLPPILDLGS
jgi:hypothetical protein